MSKKLPERIKLDGKRHVSGKHVLELSKICKYYNRGMDNEVRAVDNISLYVKEGEFVSIVGPSGSGKTTLLDVIGLLLKADCGQVMVDGHDISKMSDNQRARVRRGKIGFIFQQYNLIPSLTALENVSLSYRIGGHGKKASEERAAKLLRMVGLENRMHHRPSMLSGGESQRVAIARALANDPKIILADEPTGNLDTKTSKKILELMKWLDIEKGYTFVVVTHDPEVTRYSSRIIYLRDGKIIKEVKKKDSRLVKI